MLVVLGVDAAPGAVDEIGARRELQNVRDELARYAGFVDIEVLDRPLLTNVRARFKSFRPHVLHFIGHGAAGAGGRGLRIDGNGQQGGEIWTVEKMAIDLQGWTPRLVFINACRSAEVAAQDGTWDVIDAFARSGVDAVIGMQGDVNGAAAATFAGELYRALGDDEPIDVAVMRARIRVTDDESLSSHHPWLPSLTVTSTAESTLPRRYALAPADSQRILGHVGFERIRAFVDRKPERRALWSVLHDDALAPKVIGLQGSDVDLTVVARWCVGSMALVGRNAAFVDLSGGQHKDVLQLLGAIADELASFPSQRAANQAAFDAWLEAVDAMQPPSAPVPLPKPAGERRYERQLQEGRELAAFDVLDAFSSALRAAAGPQPIVIGLNGLSRIEPGAWSTYVVPGLIEPVLNGQLPVQLILATRGGGLVELLNGRPMLLSAIQHVSIGLLPEGEVPDLVAEYLLATGRCRAKFAPYVEAVRADQFIARDDALFAAFEGMARVIDWEEE